MASSVLFDDDRRKTPPPPHPPRSFHGRKSSMLYRVLGAVSLISALVAIGTHSFRESTREYTLFAARPFHGDDTNPRLHLQRRGAPTVDWSGILRSRKQVNNSVVHGGSASYPAGGAPRDPPSLRERLRKHSLDFQMSHKSRGSSSASAVGDSFASQHAAGGTAGSTKQRLLTSHDGERGGAAGPSTLQTPRRPLCIPMPSQHSFRILFVVLPAEAYTIGGGVSAADDGTLTVSARGAELSPLAAYVNNLKALWSYSEGLSKRSGDIELGRVPPYQTVRDSLTDDIKYLGKGLPASLSDPALLRAVNATALLLAPLQRAAEEWVFSTAEPLDVERIMIAGLMASPYVHIVDGRNISAEMLRDADYVVVPFPLANMKGRPSVLRKYRDIMSTYVPTLPLNPSKHLFVWGRIFRDTIRWKDFYGTMRPLVRRYPFRLVNVLTFEPHRIENGVKSQHAVPYPSVVRREMEGVSITPGATAAAASAQSPEGSSSSGSGTSAEYAPSTRAYDTEGVDGSSAIVARGTRIGSTTATAANSADDAQRRRGMPPVPPFAPLPLRSLSVSDLVDAYSITPTSVRDLAARYPPAGLRSTGGVLQYPAPRLECEPSPIAAADGHASSAAARSRAVLGVSPSPLEEESGDSDGDSGRGRFDTYRVPRGCSEADSAATIRFTRPLLAAFVGTAMGSNSHRTAALQQLYSCSDCVVFDPVKQWNNMAHSHFGVLWAYRTAVFCVQPPGDSPSRKGFFDAVMLGCIPVILGGGSSSGSSRSNGSAPGSSGVKSTPGGPGPRTLLVTGASAPAEAVDPDYDRDDDTGSRDHVDGGGRSPDVMTLPFSWAIEWSDVALSLPPDVWRNHLIEALRNQSASEIRARQVRLASVAPLVQWEWRLLSLKALVRRAFTGTHTYSAATARAPAIATAADARPTASRPTATPAAAVVCARDALDMTLATLYRRSPRRAEGERRRKRSGSSSSSAGVSLAGGRSGGGAKPSDMPADGKSRSSAVHRDRGQQQQREEYSDPTAPAYEGGDI